METPRSFLHVIIILAQPSVHVLIKCSVYEHFLAGGLHVKAVSYRTLSAILLLAYEYDLKKPTNWSPWTKKNHLPLPNQCFTQRIGLPLLANPPFHTQAFKHQGFGHQEVGIVL
jgi:hypothetical protein